MASQPYHARHLMMPRETSYATITSTDDMSEKTVEMDVATPLGSENSKPNRGSSAVGGDPLFESSPYINKYQSSPYVPSYMAPTQSAKAKVRSQDLLKHRSPSSKRGAVTGLAYDSSTTGGRTMAIYQAPRSPIPKAYGNRLPSKWIGGYSPDSSSEDRMPLPLGSHGFRHNFV